jgi:ribosomal protein S19E (S16A)
MTSKAISTLKAFGEADRQNRAYSALYRGPRAAAPQFAGFHRSAMEELWQAGLVDNGNRITYQGRRALDRIAAGDALFVHGVGR